MRFRQIVCIAALLLCVLHASSQKKTKRGNVIISIKGPLPEGYDPENLQLQSFPLQEDQFIYPFERKETKTSLKNDRARIKIKMNGPEYIMPGLFSQSMAYVIEPGDRLTVQWVDGKRIFSGKAAPKFRLQKNIEDFLRNLHRPEGLSSKREPVESLKDYLAWNEFLNQKTKDALALVENSKEEISDLVYIRFKSTLLNEIEKARMGKFHTLRRSKIVDTLNQFGLSNEDLCKIYDSTMDNASSKWLRFERNFIVDPDYAWEMLHDEHYRSKGKFFVTSATDTPILGKDPEDAFIYQYNKIKELYDGPVRENFLRFTLTDARGLLRNVGFTQKVEAVLADYYAHSKYPGAKQIVREYEADRRSKWNAKYAPEFSLNDIKGGLFSAAQLRGKIQIMDFWFTGCTGCVQMAPALRKVEEHFKKDSNIVFVGVSIDKNKAQWLESIKQGRFTSGGGIQLYTGGEGDNHDVIKTMMVESYPTLEIIDQNGVFIKYDKKRIDPRLDNGVAMIHFLEKQLALLKDGPYIFYKGNEATAWHVNGSEVIQSKLPVSNPTTLTVISDQNKAFSITLKNNHTNEPSEFAKPENLLALSDIEGNFDQFRKLLQANKVIDENFNWIFGKGHLVFSGDMFDRGKQVTECLWLIYSLEEKAKAAGGYVHFILGNHEIMNMQGDHGYVDRKYEDNAALLGETLTGLYGENTELGRWLRTKNIVEKIGDLLFLHAGISAGINRSTLTIQEINGLARPNYAIAKSKFDYGDPKTNLIMSPKTSPYWYRSYYDNKKEMSQVIDSTLEKFAVKHIVTGHTIVADVVSAWYNNKIINTDTKHAEGKSEALLIEADKFYRVNDEGKKVLLFTDNRRRAF